MGCGPHDITVRLERGGAMIERYPDDGRLPPCRELVQLVESGTAMLPTGETQPAISGIGRASQLR
jgi:hypothetical protein